MSGNEDLTSNPEYAALRARQLAPALADMALTLRALRDEVPGLLDVCGNQRHGLQMAVENVLSAAGGLAINTGMVESLALPPQPPVAEQ